LVRQDRVGEHTQPTLPLNAPTTRRAAPWPGGRGACGTPSRGAPPAFLAAPGRGAGRL